MRSASVSIGVLRALYHEHLLSDIDLASGASGGSWALLWLYAHAARTGSLDDLFGVDAETSTKALEQVECTRLLDLASRVRSGAAGLGRGARSSFYADLLSTFGSPTHGAASYTSPNAISVAAAEKKLPVPIFTVTALKGACDDESGLPRVRIKNVKSIPMQERLTYLMPPSRYVVELSPEAWGNNYYGFSSSWPFELQYLEYWAMTSGAFIDYPRIDECQLMDVLGAKWGHDVTLKPNGSEKSYDFYVADGGFAENLAAYPPIQRGCDLTVVIDAESDPNLEFEGYQRLKKGLRDSLNRNLEVPNIDTWLTSAPHKDSRADNPSLDIVRSPVYEGSITGNDWPVQKVLYLKLTIDPLKMSQYTVYTQRAYERAVSCWKQKDNFCFPQTPTTKTDYSMEEFRAHRDLGATLTCLYLAPKMKSYIASSRGEAMRADDANAICGASSHGF